MYMFEIPTLLIFAASGLSFLVLNHLLEDELY
jgi:hypothetical protein